jgi:hypothetical protein
MTHFLIDWQTWAALGLGLLAAGHVARRWWPAWRRPGATASACGQPAAEAAACGSGCGSCGQTAGSASKDHRIHIVRR